MKRTFVFISACFLAATSFGQKQSFDLASFIPPKAWKKELKANSHTSYTIVNKKKKTYCQIFIMLSTTSKGGIKEDFESEWQILVANQYGVTDSARRTEPSTNEGWQLLAGIAPFTFNKGISTVMLTTFTGYNKAESIVALTNSEEYIPAIQQFLQSVEMKKPSTDIAITQTMITPGSN